MDDALILPVHRFALIGGSTTISSFVCLRSQKRSKHTFDEQNPESVKR